MNRLRTRAALAIAVLAAIPALTGCFTGSDYANPLDLRVATAVIHAPGNLTLHLVYENTGSTPLSRIETWWNGDIRYVNGTARDRAQSRIGGEYGEWALKGRLFGVFNETEIFSPGAEKQANITVEYAPNDAFLQEGEVYSVVAHADFRDPHMLYRWRHLLPCIDEEGKLVTPAACDTWQVLPPREIK